MTCKNPRKSLIFFIITFTFLSGCTSSQLSAPQTARQQEEIGNSLREQRAETKKQEQNVYLPAMEKEVPEGLSEPRRVAPGANVQPLPDTYQQQAHRSKISHGANDTARIAPVPPMVEFNRESYTNIAENPIVVTKYDPLSTFSIDVDTASYANVRRWLKDGKLPPVGAVRIEEMINYFNYDYPESAKEPIQITTEVGPCLWNVDHKLVRIGIKAKSFDPEAVPPSNLVFLIDVSGSMNSANKLPLLKKAMILLTGELTSRDRVSIVAYAGTDRVVLPPTSGDQKDIIKNAISNLHSSGSTYASKGIQTAYELAKQTFMPHGNNRVILASDGDFNVGITSRGELERLIAEKRKSDIYLTVLGFGMGNYHDDTMEILADKGNGNYSYIDTLLEAKKVLIKERASTLFTVAKDVKVQMEFNPALVGAYRLLGYENRRLADTDFNDDKKDAGEIGSGHAVTALYELIPAGAKDIPSIEGLKYQKVVQAKSESNELLTVKVRYKPSGTERSVRLSEVVHDNNKKLSETSNDFRFCSSVAGFGQLLKKTTKLQDLNYESLLTTAKRSRGTDSNGYRAEFIKLLELAELLNKSS